MVQNLEKNDLVLCDMSSLNANVFFELGIRTAIGKPACVVKDDVTQKVPFDMTVVNYHTYKSTLAPWALGEEIENLSIHIKESMERSAGENLLWKYFSLSQRAQLPHPKGSEETLDRLAMLSGQIEGLSRKIETISAKPLLMPGLAEEIRKKTRPESIPLFFSEASKIINSVGAELVDAIRRDDGTFILLIKNLKKMTWLELDSIYKVASDTGVAFQIREAPKKV